MSRSERNGGRGIVSVLAAGVLVWAAGTAMAGGVAFDHPSLLLTYHDGLQAAEGGETEETVELEALAYDDLVGPYFLRSADPEAPGEVELKFIYAYETEAEGGENEFEFVLEWGMAKDLEFIFELPVTIGEGRVEGNGDIEAFGFHIRHWEEQGWLPAFATRHLIRIPTGVDSSGVDYTLRGLFTKTLSPGLRLHFNPFLKSANGDNIEDVRHFQWGFAIGVDYRFNDDVRMIADYFHRTSEEEGERNNHALEWGLDWEFAPNQVFSVATELGLDGDDSGPDWVFRVNYIYEIEDFWRLDR